jgi:uncharacterized protein YkwD
MALRALGRCRTLNETTAGEAGAVPHDRRAIMQVLRWTVVAMAAGFLALSAPAADEKGEPKLSKEEKLLIELTNKARAKEKLPPVKVNAILVQAARSHSANMVKQRKLEHELDGKRVDKRLDDLKYDWVNCGENIGNFNQLALVNELFDGWMKSPVHRKNILDPNVDEIGIAIVHSPEQKLWYVTQVFGRLEKN